MFNFVVALMLYCFWIALIGGTISLFLMRLIVALKSKLVGKQLLFVLFTPCSFGYFVTFKESSTFKKIYELLSAFFFLCILIGGVMVYYVHFQ
jgi:hypothetical protein